MTHLRSLEKNIAYAGTFAYLQFASFASAFAQGFGGNIPAIPGTANDTNGVRPAIISILNFVLGFLALVAVIFVIVGGIRIMTAGGNEENVTKGRKTIVYAIIGLIVIFFARVIVAFFTSELANAVP